MSGGVRSVRWKVLNMFKIWNIQNRIKLSVRCTVTMRWYAFCSLLVRSLFCTCPVRVRSCPVDPIHGRTTNGQAADVTYVKRTITRKNVLSVLHALRVGFVRYKSVTSTVKSVNCTSFIRYMCVDHSVIVRFVQRP